MKQKTQEEKRKDYEQKLKVYLTKRDKELRNESTNNRRA